MTGFASGVGGVELTEPEQAAASEAATRTRRRRFMRVDLRKKPTFLHGEAG
jgi:hypothetical protein